MRRPILALLLLFLTFVPAFAQAPPQVERQVQGIFERPEFWWKDSAPAQTPGWLQALADLYSRLRRWLAELFAGDEAPAPPPGGGLGDLLGLLGNLAGLALLGVAAWLLLPLLRRLAALLRLLRQEREPSSKALPADLDLSVDPEHLPGWQALERRALEVEDPRMAVRALYLASLSLLEEAGLIRYSRGTTNTEYLRQARAARAPLAEPFGDLTRGFDRAWYGRKPVEVAEIRTAWRALVQDLSR